MFFWCTSIVVACRSVIRCLPHKKRINSVVIITVFAMMLCVMAEGYASAEQNSLRSIGGKENSTGSAGEPSTQYNWFWLFYEREAVGDHNTMVVRPFYLKTGTVNRYFQASLMPFLYWRYKRTDYDQWRWFFGLGQADDVTHEGGKRDYDFGFFPLLFFGFGTDAVKENYFFLWPVGGIMKGKFVTDKISAYIFPGFLIFFFFPPASVLSYQALAYIIMSALPVYLSYEVGEFRAWSIFWPVFYYGRGGLREEFRIFPFYAHLLKRGWYDRYSFMFIFNYQRTYYTDDLHQMFFLFPVFGRKWSRSGNMSAVTFLWPFFSWGYDRRIGDWELNIPWPLVQFKDCENPTIRKRIFFPIYGEYRYMNNETMFITPFYFRLRKTSYRFDSEQHIGFLIFWFYRRNYHSQPDSYYGNVWRYFKMWPLFSVEYNDLGDRAFSMLTLLPFRDREGYERLYQPFWTIAEYVRFRNGEKRLGLLFRIWFQRWGDRFFYCKIPFVISVGRRGNRLTELTFLESMFGYFMNRKGRYCRVFWVPLRVGDSEGAADLSSEDESERGGFERSESNLLIDRTDNSVTITHNFDWSGGSGRNSSANSFNLWNGQASGPHTIVKEAGSGGGVWNDQ
ncbi:MAG: hypothetical protein A2176_16155 [Spirochaetes bacterium RBG_13_51_14]|nr:MAG: hypothetical protein A2176_16155 [Spirochaetes bacterium RBG_13_51_14]